MQYSGLARAFGLKSSFNLYRRSINLMHVDVDWVGGGCLLIDRRLFRRLNGFDHRFFLYGEDVDLCLRARDAGARIVLASDLEAPHMQGTGSRTNDAVRMAWMRNLRVIVAERRGRWGRRRLDAVLVFGALVVSMLGLTGRHSTLGRPNLRALVRDVLWYGQRI